MLEIERLHNMLTDAGIPHEWKDRTPPHWNDFIENNNPELFSDIFWGWQIIVYKDNGERLVSAIEGYGTYGYGFSFDEDKSDKIEIMGLLTPEEAEGDCVRGWLSAEEVFRRIKEAVCGTK